MSSDTPEQPTCPSCQAPVHADWRFCQECGAERPGLYEGGDADPGIAGLQDLAPAVTDEGESRGEPVPWRPLESIAVYVLSLFAVTAFVGVVAMFLGDTEDAAATDTLFIVSLIGFQLTLTALTIVWVRVRHRAPLESLGLRRPSKRGIAQGVLGGILGVAIATGIGVLQGLLIQASTGEPPPQPEQLPLEQAASIPTIVLLGIATIILAPVSEELFFRGMLFRSLRARRALRSALLISSLWFAFAHTDLGRLFGGDPLGALILIAPILSLAFVLGTLMDRWRNVWVPIVAHATFNVVGFSMQLPELMRG